MTNKWTKYELEDWINLILTVLFWSSILSFLLGWGQLGIILGSLFFFNLGAIILTIFALYLSEGISRSKINKLTQWIFLISGLAILAIGAWALNLNEAIYFVLALPMSKIIAKHSIRDITNDKARDKYPFLDHLSDGFFILSIIFCTLAFFNLPTQIMIGWMLTSLSISLNLDQIHKACNHQVDLAIIGSILVSTILFLIPGIILILSNSLFF